LKRLELTVELGEVLLGFDNFHRFVWGLTELKNLALDHFELVSKLPQYGES
jgi:hypothetical protein